MESKYLLFALLLSLAINIFLVLLVAVHATRVHRKSNRIRRVAATIVFSSKDEQEKPQFAASTFRAISAIYEILNN